MAAWNPEANEIFLKAMEIPSLEARQAYLDEVCHDDGLRGEVEALIAAGEQAGSFLESPPPGLTAAIDAADVGEQPGMTIGPYKLLEQIGEGGMGLVFMAEQQEPVRRRVALKLIKPGMDTRQVIARFEAERQALAVMDHPSIARVLDAGATQSGRPYFVMELVRGVPITKYCDEANLPIRERLQLFTSVCQAIQHAHTKGIIHRDIKPTNVLVTRLDGQAVVKVIDFGVAKAMGQQLTEKTLFTNFAQMIGTPLYMSPEQAEQSGVDIDTRSDIYSLGVLLYELLTEATPVSAEQMKQAAFDEIRRIIREDEPLTPSARISGSHRLAAIAAHRHTEPARLSKLVRGELDWIVMKALEKDRSRRYETANAFAADVLHYLNDERVLACPPSAMYRFGKFARRNRAALGTAALVAGLLVAGTLASTWQAIRATRAEQLSEQRLIAETTARAEADLARLAEADQRKRAEVQQAEAETQRAIAEEQHRVAEINLLKAKEAVDNFFTLVSESKLLDVPGLQPLRKELLESALEFYKNLTIERVDDPTLLADLAVTYIRVAEINHTVDRNDDALAAVDQAVEVIERLRSQFPDAVSEHRRLAGFWKGSRRSTQTTAYPSDPAAAFRSINRLIELWKILADEFPDEIAFRSDVAALFQRTGDLLASGGQIEQGLAYYEHAKSVGEELVRDRPNAKEYRADLARTYEHLARRLDEVKRGKEAEAACERALMLREQLVADSPDSPQYRSDLGNSLVQSALLLMKSDPQQAELVARRAKDLFQALVEQYPGADLYQSELASATRRWLLARIATMVGCEKLAAAHSSFPDSRRELARSYNLLGILLRNVGRNEESVAELQKAQELWSRGDDPEIDKQKRAAEAAPEDGLRWHMLFIAYYNGGQWENCLWAIKKKQEVFTASVWEWFYQAMAHWQLDQPETAYEWFHKALSWMDESPVPQLRVDQAQAALLLGLPDPGERVDQARDYSQQALDLEAQGQHDQAKEVYGKAVNVYETLVADYPLVASYNMKLFGLLVKSGRQEEASALVPLVRKLYSGDAGYLNNVAWRLAKPANCDAISGSLAVELANKGIELEPLNAFLPNTLGVAHYRSGNWQDAIEWLRKSVEVRKGGDSFDWFFLAMAYWQLDNKDEARKWHAKAIEWMDANKPQHHELLRFRAEAVQLIQMAEGQ